MKRITVLKDKTFLIPVEFLAASSDGFFGEASERLAAFENAFERIGAEQQEIEQTLDRLRAAGKEKTVQFREQFGKRLMNQQFLMLLEAYGIKN